ncbi:MAG: hypothetical protein Q6L60_14005, partial [Thermostichus sp. HHBFW_bins_43]
MPCSACEALPVLPQGPGRLFLWLPIPHSHHKLVAAFAAGSLGAEAPAEQGIQSLENLGLVIPIREQKLQPTLERIAGILAAEEMHASR